MLKRERLLKIRHLVADKGIVTVNEIGQALGVSTMTVRRDLDELANAKLLVRVHGGASSLNLNQLPERSRAEKINMNPTAKAAIAKKAAGLIADGDTVFLGSGTTLELMAKQITAKDVRVVTNSLQVFQRFLPEAGRISLQLIGGSYRAQSGAFIGSLANEVLERLRTNKAFIGTNGLADKAITTTSPEEGQTLRIALKNADESFVLCDHSKLDRQDFYTFYTLDQVSGMITDDEASNTQLAHYQDYTKVLIADL